jgi:hypothetical protein
MIPFFLVAPIAAYLWQKSINGPGSDMWGLHRQAVIRKLIFPCGFLFWIVGFFYMASLNAANQPVGVNLLNQNSDSIMWLTVSTYLLIPALAGWSIVLFHLSKISLYLRNELLHKACVYLYWSMALVSLPVLYVCYKSESLVIFEQFLWIFALITMLTSVFFAILLAWDLANCLTHSYDTLAREERLAKQNSERYSSPK